MSAVAEHPTVDPLLTPAEAARLLGISADRLRRLANRDEVPHVRLGYRTLRFRLSSLQAWITERERGR